MKSMMKYPFILLLAMGSGLMMNMTDSVAQGNGDKDPARWYAEDVTPQSRYQTSKKEANAAYKEAQAACKKMARHERAKCISDARKSLQSDLAEAKKIMIQTDRSAKS